jgi:hypothetical protein
LFRAKCRGVCLTTFSAIARGQIVSRSVYLGASE